MYVAHPIADQESPTTRNVCHELIKRNPSSMSRNSCSCMSDPHQVTISAVNRNIIINSLI